MQRVLLCGCVCLFSSITKVQFGATKSVNRKSTWRSKTCTGKKLRTRRHKMQDESSSNGWVQAANGQEVNAGKVPCITHTHTHTVGGELWANSYTSTWCYFRCSFAVLLPQPRGSFCVCVCGSPLFLALCPGHVPRAYCRLLSLFLPSPCLLLLAPSSVSATTVCQGAAFYVQMICTPASAFDFFSFIVSLFIVSPCSAPHTLSENEQSCR